MKLIPVILLLCAMFGATVARNSSAAEALQQNNKESLVNILKRIRIKYQEFEVESSHPSINVIPDAPYYSSNIDVNSNNDTSSIRPTELHQGIPTGEELLLSVYIGKLYLADIFGYKNDKGAQLNLRDLFSVLDFPIDIDINNKVVKGWFIREDNLFELNIEHVNGTVQRAYVSINGNTIQVADDEFLIENNDIYVDGDVISAWFNLNLVYKFNDLRIELMPADPLPIQLRLARENKDVFAQKENLPIMPWKESSYQMLSSPMMDFQFQSVKNKKNQLDYNAYSALGSHDIAYFNAEYYVSGRSQDVLSDARLKFSRDVDPELEALGLNSVGSIEFGDINSVSITSQYNSGLNRGFLYSSKALTDINDNQRININGDIQAGWDVELYQNSIFVAKQSSVQTGRYEFNNIDLLFGNNTFEIISYGPQGQVKKEYKEVYVNSNALKGAEHSYAFSISQSGKSLLGVNDELTSTSKGLLFAGTYSQGITDWFSISLGQSSLRSDDGVNEYNYSVSSSLNLFQRLLLNTSFNINQDDYSSSYLTARTEMFGQSLFYSFTQNQRDLVVDELAEKKQSTQHSFKMQGNLFNSNNYRLNYSNNYDYQNSISGIDSTLLQNQLALSAGRFSIQHTLSWYEIAEYESLIGSMQANLNFGGIFGRLNIGYSVKPNFQADYVNTELSWSIYDNLQSELGINYVLTDDSYDATFGLTWTNDYVNLTSQVKYDELDDWAVGLYLRFGIGYDMDNNKPFISSSAMARNGATAVRIFEDVNNNGVYDYGDNPIEGAKVKAAQSHRQAISSSDGIAVIKNLHNKVDTDILLDNATLGDPFFIPSTAGVSITPRKGFLEHIEYPVVTSSEIDGSVYAIDIDGNQNILAYVPVNLLNKDGQIVKTTQSEYDGYYLFTEIIPGQYFVSVDQAYVKKHKLENINDLAINLTVQGDVVSGSDFVLRELEFTQGFAVNAGEFDNLSMLKVYWHLIQQRYRAKLKQVVFYSYDDVNRKYLLNLGFYQDKLEGIEACEQVSLLNINCEVKAFEFVEK